MLQATYIDPYLGVDHTLWLYVESQSLPKVRDHQAQNELSQLIDSTSLITDRPAWTTGTLIPLGFISGIGAAVLIWKGGERCKKTKEVEAHLREALAQEKAILKARYGDYGEEQHGVELGVGVGGETARMGIGGPPSLIEKPSILGHPASSDSMKQGSQRSPPRPVIHIDETMTIPEAQEPSSGTSKKEKDSFYTPDADNKV